MKRMKKKNKWIVCRIVGRLKQQGMERQRGQSPITPGAQGAKKACYTNPGRGQRCGEETSMGATVLGRLQICPRGRAEAERQLGRLPASPFSSSLAQQGSLNAAVYTGQPLRRQSEQGCRQAGRQSSNAVGMDPGKCRITSTPSFSGVWQEGVLK